MSNLWFTIRITNGNSFSGQNLGVIRGLFPLSNLTNLVSLFIQNLTPAQVLVTVMVYLAYIVQQFFNWPLCFHLDYPLRSVYSQHSSQLLYLLLIVYITFALNPPMAPSQSQSQRPHNGLQGLLKPGFLVMCLT